MIQVALIQNTNTDLAVTPPEAAAPEPVSPLSESKSDAAPIHTSSISLWASNFNRACVRACVRAGAEADALLFACWDGAHVPVCRSNGSRGSLFHVHLCVQM